MPFWRPAKNGSRSDARHILPQVGTTLPCNLFNHSCIYSEKKDGGPILGGALRFVQTRHEVSTLR